MDKVIKTLEDGYQIIETDTRHCEFGGVSGWVSYWLVDRNGETIETFASACKAERWYEANKDDIGVTYDANVEKLARSLTKKMGLKWETLSEEEKEEWIEECTD
jgi:hypothetical protein